MSYTARQRKYKDERQNIAVKELDSYRKRQRDILYYTQKLEECRENYYISVQDYERLHVSGGKSIDTVAEIGIRWAEEEAKLSALKAQAAIEIIPISFKLNSLSCTQREVIQLYYLEGLSISEVADKMNFSEEWVKSTKHSALKAYSLLIPIKYP